MANRLKRLFSRKSFNTPESSLNRTLATPNSYPASYDHTLDILGTNNAYYASYETIWRTHPNVRTVCDFLARNIAQLGLKVYERAEDTERNELHDSPLARLLRYPNPYIPRYQFMYGTVEDMAIYDAAFWIKTRDVDGQLRGLTRIPPKYMAVIGTNLLRPDYFVLSQQGPGSTEGLRIDRDDVVYFHGYHPGDLRVGTSPLETLRRVISQESAMDQHVADSFENGNRAQGILKHPERFADQDAADRFVESWRNARSKADGTPILEDGMDWVPNSFNLKDSEFVRTRELTMLTVARAYHIPPPMVGLLEAANFASIQEFHTMLFQDTLGPWTVNIEETIELQLVPEFGSNDKTYVEFNLEEKMKGRFEEQGTLGVSVTGGPWMTINEWRARQNLNPIEGGDDLVQPLNTQRGGGDQPSPNDPEDLNDPQQQPGAPELEAASAPDVFYFKADPVGEETADSHITQHTKVIQEFFARQASVVLSKMGAKADAPDDWADDGRWNRELKAELLKLAGLVASDAGISAARRFNGEFDVTQIGAYLEENSRIAAENINLTTKQAIDEAQDLDVVRSLFAGWATSRAPEIAQSRVTNLTNFGTHEAAAQTGLASKTWIVTSARSRHPQLNGEVKSLSETFSNGAMWPGDPVLSVDQRAGCMCLVAYGSS